MGDPEETGRALCAQYGGWWLVIVQRAARILTAILCVMIAGLIVKSSGLYGAIRDRYEVQKPGEGWERWNTETPGTRIPIGDDIVRIDAVSCSTQRAEVQLTAFDRIPGGVVYARLLHTLRLENERGDRRMGRLRLSKLREQQWHALCVHRESPRQYRAGRYLYQAHL